MIRTLYIVLILSLSQLIHLTDRESDDPYDAYQYGVVLIEEGNWQNALNFWIEARDSLSDIGESDFRIGRKFIEVATQKNRTDLYTLASEFYIWGLQAQDINKAFVEVVEEVQMMEPIIPESLYRDWRAMVQNRDEKIFAEIRGFWILNDPVPDTPMNERLIEHWERIAYARENFTVNRRTVYGTDERGKIYVKMGEPEKVESGNFMLNNSRVQFFAREILRQQQYEVDSFGQDQSSGGGRGVQDMAMESYYMNNLAKAITDRVLSQRISSKYEVWIYNSGLMNIPENLIFIFGEDAATGYYGLVRSPENFIPTGAYRPLQVRGSNFRFNSGPILQLSIYDDLKKVDDKFLDIFNDISDRMMSDESIISESATSYLMVKYGDELESMRNAAPIQYSLYDRDLVDFQLSAKRFLFYDEEENPYYLLVAFSEPHEAILIDNARFTNYFDDLEPRYFLKHTLTVYDADWNIKERLQDFPAVSFETDDVIGELLPSNSLLRIPAYDSNTRVHLSASVYNETLSERGYSNKHQSYIVPDYIVGSGFAEINFNNSDLSIGHSTNGEFKASDLVVGYRSDFDLEDELFIPFYIPPDNVLSKSVDLYFLIEAYNIPLTAGGFHEFNLEYQVIPQTERRGLGRLFRGNLTSEQQINLTFESERSTSKNYISVDISDYRPGKYTLRIILSDPTGENQILREADFKIVE